MIDVVQIKIIFYLEVCSIVCRSMRAREKKREREGERKGGRARERERGREGEGEGEGGEREMGERKKKNVYLQFYSIFCK